MKGISEGMGDHIKGFIEQFRSELVLISIAVVILLASISFFSYIERNKQKNEITIVENAADKVPSPTQATQFVHIAGAVEKPNVYEMPENSRLRDVLEKANGLSGKADREYFERNFNLAELLVDGQKIYIPSKEEVEEGIVAENTTPRESRLLGVSQKNGGININSATQSELESLAGVGVKTAEKIIQNRPYISIDELLQKKVVGKATYEKIRNAIVAE